MADLPETISAQFAREWWKELMAPDDGVAAAIRRAAQVIEMQLIEDHTRQQDAPDETLIDSVQELHWVVMPHAHPEEFAAFPGRVTDPEAASE